MSVEYALVDEVAVITLNRPQVFNSIDQSLTDGLRVAFEQASTEARAAVLTGAGKAFCAGADLSDLLDEYAHGGPDLHKTITERFNPAVDAVLDAELPVVAAVNGAAAGAGMGLALACDVRVMAETAFFMSAFINVALVPDTGSAWFLPQMVGVSRAMEIAMSGRRVLAQEALELGLTAEVVETDAVVATAVERAAAMTAGPRRAYVETRRIIHLGAAATLKDTIAREAQIQGELGARAAHREGMAAFVEKRQPNFRQAD
ncbi:MAG TPA: enoyl-CoA hydratase-related protein [Acidimicrobiia bacterium]|nr:enoyl-CoA hydratase-related protein [Acidimicrobiia bacterium]